MRRRGLINVVGVVQRKDTGRPEIVYGRQCKAQEVEHEVWVAELENILRAKFARGVEVGDTEPDGLMKRDGFHLAIEIDRSGKMTQAQMEMKWKRYSGFKGLILVVALTESRMQRLREGAALVKNQALFTTFKRLQSGQEQPWLDGNGKPASV